MKELQVQLAWNRLLAIVEEQAQVLMRTAFSTVVREAGDLSAGVFDVRGEMLAQAVTGTPGHVNSMAEAVKKFLAKYPASKLKPGDVLLTNDPWDGTGHLNDFTVVTPVFLSSEIIGFFASTSHIADVGGRGFGPDANDLFEEGLRVPISYLLQKGEPNQTLMDLIKANVRDPLVAEGDLYSLIACNETGSIELLEMLNDLDLRDLEEIGRIILDRSKNAMREEINRLGFHDVQYEMIIDGYDEPVHICCRMVIDQGIVDLDFGGSSRASSKGINVPFPYTIAYASFGVRCLIGNEIPNNSGSLALIRVSAPEASLLNAKFPRAVSARHSIGQMLPDVVIGCLHQVMPDRVPCEGASCIWNPVFMNGIEAETGNLKVDRFVINPIFNGGTGARPHKDGMSTTAFPSGVRTTSTEVNEATSPLIFWRKEYRSNSGGKGEFRGGLGQTIEISHRYGSDFVVSKMFDRIIHPARGRDGGDAGEPGRVAYVSSEGDVTELPGKGRDVIPAGCRLVMETPGGGGLGSPESRAQALLESDKANGLVDE
ncbi:MAG: hydantoinase B/oxoprolinase family protein [Candidatus Azotimanducaceae bacterium]